ncbi:helix-turn-helix domain-containing protein [Paenibacillus alvei]|uniref:helix-turn-helix domain-containing protein n=1 Tax=Paenibacillus alvei TaxID=44250 RepID=UPI0002881DBD|nr:helix-turn-helix transcriptional regulator [Paenibacillus alvei]EJW19028.1 putative transcriptional regulator [Paenibacillus alvei DSM 29]MCY9543688.1 helix-turn-helix domain-containing protein [Paenibacillus alvei]MCY9737195.1 helix-turn-helix domain-containing protein [Paenibacillus alvei]MCY9758152.1 helix-turn-helix domain-containing protein [Paenibacillus alvei]MEC0082881.1 helix-turn-helix transcriptional regulator [Paenibacillus alvei]
MNSRIKAIREHLGLSQREFGEKLGVSRDVISNLEYNRVQPKELLIKHICELYSVNEKWLLSGEGDMFVEEQPHNKKLEEALAIFKELQPDFQDYALDQIKKLSALQSKRLD